MQAHYNLAWLHTRWGKYKEALADIAAALALDETGAYYERLTKKQAEVLGRMSQRIQQKMLMLANRVSKRPVEQQRILTTEHAHNTEKKGSIIT